NGGRRLWITPLPFSSHRSQPFHHPQGRVVAGDSAAVVGDHHTMRIPSYPIHHDERRVTHHLRHLLRALLAVLIVWALPLSFLPDARAYVNPASGLPRAGTVLRSFDKPEHNWLPGHRGVDLPLEI